MLTARRSWACAGSRSCSPKELIPPTAGQQDEGSAQPTVRRWSAMAATRKRFEPCGSDTAEGGECPVATIKFVKKTVSDAAVPA